MTILDEIVDRTTRDLQKRRQSVAESELREQVHFNEPRRPFETAIAQDGLGVIAEIKRASPSKGVIREEFSVTDIARQYEDAGAAAISVLTEPNYFQGSLENLSVARGAASLPILRKDFVVDPYQVVEARAFGADAVLLIATCLEASQLEELLHACRELSMAHLVEVYSPHDLDKIDFDEVRVLGVNSRDLKTFEVDLQGAIDVFRLVPDSMVRVAESGISNEDDIRVVLRAGVDAILVGEALMRAAQPGDALGSLLETTRDLETQVGINEEQ
ncbi:MAG: indole-3-glycerol phosphate synthase TrpC [Rhodothermia bacterium]|nr:indole-3-glycerol phosphate synthase TrpC [Rhodothermia bacterium]